MENAANRAWHVPREAVLIGDRCQLLDEERVSLGGLCDSRSDPPRSPERLQHRLRVGVGEGLEHQRRRRRPGPVRPALEELGAGEAEEDDRGVGEAARQVLDEVEEGRLGPVHVVEDRDERPVGRKVLEDLADGGEGLVARAVEYGLVAAGLSQELA